MFMDEKYCESTNTTKTFNNVVQILRYSVSIKVTQIDYTPFYKFTIFKQMYL